MKEYPHELFLEFVDEDEPWKFSVHSFSDVARKFQKPYSSEALWVVLENRLIALSSIPVQVKLRQIRDTVVSSGGESVHYKCKQWVRYSLLEALDDNTI